MSKPWVSLVLVLSGVLIGGVSVFADLLGLGKPGIPAAQLLLAEIGAVIALAGVWLALRQRRAGAAPYSLGRAVEAILTAPLIIWVVAGFLLAYLLCFVAPAIFNAAGRFQYFTDYLMPHEHIGFDTRMILEDVRVWFLGERPPSYLFPPLTTILFTPLLMLRYPVNFYLVAAVTLISFPILNLVLPLLIIRKEHRALIYFIFGVSVFSYGLQFELDTGQFYTAAMLLLLASIYIFHRHPAYRLLAYMLFSISVQLKIFPAFFVLMFVDDWRDWKANLKRFAALGAANFLLLFLLGFRYFGLFVRQTLAALGLNEVAYNHSVRMYVRNLAASGYGLAEGAALTWIRENVALLQGLLYAFVILCILLVLLRSYGRNAKGIDVTLLFALVLGVLTLPSINHDYNLPLLAAPFMLWVSTQASAASRPAKVLSILLVAAAAFAYAATLFPSNARPPFLENSFPSLFILLAAVTLSDFIPKLPEAEGASPND
ncbi:MAG: glycosyltransferase 87 family protein [Bacteroidota bacterium]